MELRPHQRTALEKMRNGTVLTGGVGTGKTITALYYFYEKECGGTVGNFSSVKTPKDIYVFTTANKRDKLDWQGAAAKLGIGTERDASVAGIQLVVESYNNIVKYSQVKDAFIILDEQRMVGSGAWTKTFLRMAKNNRWIMLSATPGDTWMDYIPLFVANGFYKNRTEFKRRHVVYNTFSKFPKVDHYVETGVLNKLRLLILVEMPYERHTKRHIHTVPVDYDVEAFERVVKKRWNIYEQRPLKDVGELFSVMRKVVNSDSSRIAALRSLMEKHPRLIVFYNFDYELQNLRSLVSGTADPSSSRKGSEEWTSTNSKSGFGTISTSSSRDGKPSGSGKSGFSPKLTSTSQTSKEASSSPTETARSLTLAEWNGHKHEPVPDTDRWVYLVQYVAGAEAWECVTTDAMAFYSLTYSYKNFEQSQGRIDRLNTPFIDLHYYVLMSSSAIDKAVSKSLRNKQDFQEKTYGS